MAQWYWVRSQREPEAVELEDTVIYKHPPDIYSAAFLILPLWFMASADVSSNNKTDFVLLEGLLLFFFYPKHGEMWKIWNFVDEFGDLIPSPQSLFAWVRRGNPPPKINVKNNEVNIALRDCNPFLWRNWPKSIGVRSKLCNSALKHTLNGDKTRDIYQAT